MKKTIFFVSIIVISTWFVAMLSAGEVETESLEYILLHQEYFSTNVSNLIIDTYMEDDIAQYTIPHFGTPYYSDDYQTYWVAEFIYSKKELDIYLKNNDCNGWLLVELKTGRIFEIKQKAIMKTTRREIIEEYIEGYKWKKREYQIEKVVPETPTFYQIEVDTIKSDK